MKINHIVIIGAGFAGLRLARKLNNNPDFKVTLVDRNNFHQFQPLMYQVATANLDASNISFPLRSIFQKSKNVTIRISELNTIDTANKSVHTSTGILAYDTLVIATGADTNYFGNKEIKNHAFPMKSTMEALQLRNQIIQNFEDATMSTNTDRVEQLLTVVVVGGGPTGIELSGALAELKHEKIPHEYPELNEKLMKIYLLEGSPKVLGNMSENASKKAKEYLEKMGVIVITNTYVKAYDGESVLLQDGGSIASSMVIWAAGITGNLPSGIAADRVGSGNRIIVDEFNRVQDVENVFALGDIAFMATPHYPKGLPQVANVAIDQASNLAKNLKNLNLGKPLIPYKYNNKGSMATVGRNKAVVDLAKPRLSFQGFFAWLLWMVLHLFLLIGFKNRMVVFINWVYKYFMRNQSLSLLLTPLLKRNKPEN